MATCRSRSGAVQRPRKPTWMSDKGNQEKWIAKFIGILARDYANSDAVISAILSDHWLRKLCATRIRFYVDEGFTRWSNAQTKARGAEHKEQLHIAVAGLHAAIGLLKNRGNQQSALNLGELADEFSRELRGCKQAFGTKRHGRDRDHSILYECHSFLESELKKSITNRTLTDLVNAGYEADGTALKDPVAEEQIRKNLANFKRNNPLWRNYIDPRFQQLIKEPETK